MVDNPSDLVGKEFIFEYGVDRILPPSDKTGGIFAIEQRSHRRERVVRCRDCKHGDAFCDSSSYAGMIDCTHFAQWDYDNDDFGIWPVEPDGFCAWGSERDGE